MLPNGMPDTTYCAGGRFRRSRMRPTSAADSLATCSRESANELLRNLTKASLVSMATRCASGRIRRRISAVMVPTPGPYSTITLARSQSTGRRTSLTRYRELGQIEPSMKGWRKKFSANNSRWARGEWEFTGMSDPSVEADVTTCLILRDSLSGIIRAHGLLRLEAAAEEPG